MDFLNKCIINMFCKEKCINYGICNENNIKTINTNACSVCNFVNWLNDNEQNISDLIKSNK